MHLFDIILGIFLVYGFIKGFRNGLFCELASLISLLAGIYFAIKFSFLMQGVLVKFVHWNPKTIQITAFLLTFLIVVLVVTLLAKVMTGMANFAFLGFLNSLGGGFVHVLKSVLILSVFFALFEKVNFDFTFAKKETLDNSIFYRPIQKTAGFIYPTIEKWYMDIKKN